MQHLNETLNEKAMKAYVWAWADGEGNYAVVGRTVISQSAGYGNPLHLEISPCFVFGYLLRSDAG
jgi:hypothetical protein